MKKTLTFFIMLVFAHSNQGAYGSNNIDSSQQKKTVQDCYIDINQTINSMIDFIQGEMKYPYNHPIPSTDHFARSYIRWNNIDISRIRSNLSNKRIASNHRLIVESAVLNQLTLLTEKNVPWYRLSFWEKADTHLYKDINYTSIIQSIITSRDEQQASQTIAQLKLDVKTKILWIKKTIVEEKNNAILPTIVVNPSVIFEQTLTTLDADLLDLLLTQKWFILSQNHQYLYNVINRSVHCIPRYNYTKRMKNVLRVLWKHGANPNVPIRYHFGEKSISIPPLLLLNNNWLGKFSRIKDSLFARRPRLFIGLLHSKLLDRRDRLEVALAYESVEKKEIPFLESICGSEDCKELLKNNIENVQERSNALIKEWLTYPHSASQLPCFIPIKEGIKNWATEDGIANIIAEYTGLSPNDTDDAGRTILDYTNKNTTAYQPLQHFGAKHNKPIELPVVIPKSIEEHREAFGPLSFSLICRHLWNEKSNEILVLGLIFGVNLLLRVVNKKKRKKKECKEGVSAQRCIGQMKR
jgi:hypothetical protein